MTKKGSWFLRGSGMRTVHKQVLSNEKRFCYRGLGGGVRPGLTVSFGQIWLRFGGGGAGCGPMHMFDEIKTFGV